MRLAADPHAVTPERYDAWYDTPRGRWIGGVEWPLLRSALELRAGDSVLDVGCGTGWFTRRVAAEGPASSGWTSMKARWSSRDGTAPSGSFRSLTRPPCRSEIDPSTS